MEKTTFNIVTARDFVVNNNGIEEQRTFWNKVGRAWISANGESINFELFMFPHQKYVIKLTPKNSSSHDKSENQNLTPQQNSESVPF